MGSAFSSSSDSSTSSASPAPPASPDATAASTASSRFTLPGIIARVANDLEADLAGQIKEFACDRVCAALYSVMPGNSHFSLTAIFLGNSKTRKKEARVVTGLVGEPYTQPLDRETIRGRDWSFADPASFGLALKDHLHRSSGVHAYFLVFWKGDHLPAPKTPIAFTDDITSTHELTGDRLNALIHNTFSPASSSTPYSFSAIVASTGETSIPGVDHLYNSTDLVGKTAGRKIETHIGPFKV